MVTFGISESFQGQEFHYCGVERQPALFNKLKYGDSSVHLADGGDAKPGVAPVGDFPGAVGVSAGADEDVALIVGHEHNTGDGLVAAYAVMQVSEFSPYLEPVESHGRYW